MSKNSRISWDDGMAAAGAILDILRPVVDRVEVAGSLRRGAETVGDIEILAIPAAVPDLFGGEVRGPVMIDQALAGRGFTFEANGPLYKRFILQEPAGVRCDLFLTTPEQWGVMLAIRTGPSGFSMQIVTPRNKGGLLPSYLKIHDGRVWNAGKALSTPEESDLFQVLGLPMLQPNQR